MPYSKICLVTSFSVAATTSSMRVGWMRPSVMSFSRLRRATSRRTGSKRADHDHAGRVVHDHVHAGGLLERADVPALPADHAALHVVGGDVHGRDGRVGGVFGGVALDGADDDLAGLHVGVLAGLVQCFSIRAEISFSMSFSIFDNSRRSGLVHREVGDLQKLRLLLGDEFVELAVLGRERFFAFDHGLFGHIDHPLLGVERFELLVDRVLTLGKPFFLVVAVPAWRLRSRRRPFYGAAAVHPWPWTPPGP